MRTIPLLTATLTAISLCASAFAASPVFQAAGQGVQVTVEPSASTAKASASTQALPATVIYSNFGTGDVLYDCCSGWGVSGRHSMWGQVASVAMPFTPEAPATIKRVRLALGLINGTNEVKVSLNNDLDGLPGAPLKQLLITELPTAGQCCLTVKSAFGGATLVPGQTYWIVARVRKPIQSDTMAIWHFNSTGVIADGALNMGSGWIKDQIPQGAFEVLGR